jgi:hypothetical protein
VQDHNVHELPVRREPAAGDVSGRGLGIVDAMADAWGIDVGDAAKTVWFEIPLAAPRAPPGP